MVQNHLVSELEINNYKNQVYFNMSLEKLKFVLSLFFILLFLFKLLCYIYLILLIYLFIAVT